MAGDFIVAHDLKVWPNYFEPIVKGEKTFEVRFETDRKFLEGDLLWLREWNQLTGFYTGRQCLVRVGYILRESPFLQNKAAVLSIKVVERV